MKNPCKALALVAAVLSGAACNIGNAPEPMAPEDVKAAVEKLSPEQQIEWVNRSPMPAAEKQRRIDEIKQKTGYSGETKAPSAPGAPNAPGG